MKGRSDRGRLRKDLTGLKFGKLLVKRFLEYRNQGTNKVAFFLCVCDCGAEKEVKGTHLSRGDTKTCGSSVHRTLPNMAAKSNAKFIGYKRHAEARNYEWGISYPFFDSLIRMSCLYCGAKASPFNGVDRVDNNLGYSEDNVVPCCKQCNKSKSDLSVETFLNWVEAIYERQNFGGTSEFHGQRSGNRDECLDQHL